MAFCKLLILSLCIYWCKPTVVDIGLFKHPYFLSSDFVYSLVLPIDVLSCVVIRTCEIGETVFHKYGQDAILRIRLPTNYSVLVSNSDYYKFCEHSNHFLSAEKYEKCLETVTVGFHDHHLGQHTRDSHTRLESIDPSYTSSGLMKWKHNIVKICFHYSMDNGLIAKIIGLMRTISRYSGILFKMCVESDQRGNGSLIYIRQTKRTREQTTTKLPANFCHYPGTEIIVLPKSNSDDNLIKSLFRQIICVGTHHINVENYAGFAKRTFGFNSTRKPSTEVVDFFSCQHKSKVCGFSTFLMNYKEYVGIRKRKFEDTELSLGLLDFEMASRYISAGKCASHRWTTIKNAFQPRSSFGWKLGNKNLSVCRIESTAGNEHIIGSLFNSLTGSKCIYSTPSAVYTEHEQDNVQMFNLPLGHGSKDFEYKLTVLPSNPSLSLKNKIKRSAVWSGNTVGLDGTVQKAFIALARINRKFCGPLLSAIRLDVSFEGDEWVEVIGYLTSTDFLTYFPGCNLWDESTKIFIVSCLEDNSLKGPLQLHSVNVLRLIKNTAKRSEISSKLAYGSKITFLLQLPMDPTYFKLSIIKLHESNVDELLSIHADFISAVVKISKSFNDGSEDTELEIKDFPFQPNQRVTLTVRCMQNKYYIDIDNQYFAIFWYHDYAKFVTGTHTNVEGDVNLITVYNE